MDQLHEPCVCTAGCWIASAFKFSRLNRSGSGALTRRDDGSRGAIQLLLKFVEPVEILSLRLEYLHLYSGTDTAVQAVTFIIVIRRSWLTEEVVLNTPPFLDNLKDRILPCFDSCSFVYFWVSFWRSRIGIVKLTFGAIRSIAKPFTKLEPVSWINDFPTIVQFISPEYRFRPPHQSESRIPNLVG